MTRDAARVEDVLAIHWTPYDAREPAACLDGKPVALHADPRPPQPARPGHLAKRHDEYLRCGTASIFAVVQPKAGRAHDSSGDGQPQYPFGRTSSEGNPCIEGPGPRRLRGRLGAEYGADEAYIGIRRLDSQLTGCARSPVCLVRK